MTSEFTDTQGQYLAFIYNYTVMFGRPPAEADLERFFRTSFPTVHQMVLRLEEKGFLSRIPGQARSIRLLVDPDTIPRLRDPRAAGDRTTEISEPPAAGPLVPRWAHMRTLGEDS